MKKIIDTLKQKYPHLESLLQLGSDLSGTVFNTVLLELYKKQAAKVKVADLVVDFTQNRFVLPSKVNALAFKSLELAWLQMADSHGFEPIILSPLTPLGTCSAVAEVNQNNVVSGGRGTEVVSDVTNVLALKIAADFKENKNPDIVKYATTHRHVRGQAFDNPAFTVHFGVFCAVSGGLDTGSYDFELIEDYEKGDYYRLVRFGINLKHHQMDINLSDGGLVDWTQKLIPNKKHRLFISGCGIELVHKIWSNV